MCISNGSCADSVVAQKSKPKVGKMARTMPSHRARWPILTLAG
jgi:hypothetical protein